VLPLLLVLIGLAVYANSFTGPFIFDDYSSIVDNPHIRRLWPLSETLSSPPEIALAGRPVAALSVALNYALGRLDVRGYHAVSLALHIWVALLLFGIVRRTLRGERLHSRFGREAPLLALSVALLWMVHPLLTESVAYIIQRTELLVGLWYLLTLYCVIRGAEASGRMGWYAAAVVSCDLGMASKEVMVSAPLGVWLYDRTFLSTSFRDALRRRRGLYLGLALSWLVLAALVAAGARTTTAGFGARGLTPWSYAMTQCGVIVHYLRLAVWPHPLVVDYSDWPVARTLTDVMPQALVLFALVLATLWALRRRSAWGCVGASFFLLLAPTSSILPIVTEVAAERRMYLPLSAVVVLLVMGGWNLLRRAVADNHRSRRLAVWLVAALAGTLGCVTVRRNEVYRSERSVLYDVIAKRPRNAHAHYNLGIALAEQGKWEEAIGHFVEALRLNPDYTEAHNNLGLALDHEGRREEAVAHYREALRLNPSLAEPHNNLASVLAEEGKIQEAVAEYAEALRLRPDDALARRNLAVILKLEELQPAANR